MEATPLRLIRSFITRVCGDFSRRLSNNLMQRIRNRDWGGDVHWFGRLDLAELPHLKEDSLRAHILAALLFVSASGVAMADESVSGTWHADMGDGVVINMSVTPDGNWNSETSQNSKVVRQMQGTYTQKKSSDTAGVLVFTPTKATTRNGKATIETDRYELTGDQLKLTSGGDTMVFDKQAAH